MGRSRARGTSSGPSALPRPAADRRGYLLAGPGQPAGWPPCSRLRVPSVSACLPGEVIVVLRETERSASTPPPNDSNAGNNNRRQPAGLSPTPSSSVAGGSVALRKQPTTAGRSRMCGRERVCVWG